MDLVAGNESLLDSLIGEEKLATEITPEGRPPIWGLPRVLVSKHAGSTPRPLVPLGPMPFHLCPNFDLVAGDESLLDSRIGEITTRERAPPGRPPRGIVSRPAGSLPPSTLGTSWNMEMLLGLLGEEGGPSTVVSQGLLPSSGGSPPGLGPGPTGPSPPSPSLGTNDNMRVLIDLINEQETGPARRGEASLGDSLILGFGGSYSAPTAATH